MLYFFILLGVLLGLPVLWVSGTWLVFDARSADIFTQLSATVLPDYALQSLWLGLGVAVGVALVGGATAVLVTLFDFPGRRFFEWALLLPLAVPAYVLAYAATDFLQFSGPLQMGLRALMGWQGPLWPDVRSLAGAIVLFVLCLYPYVYLLTRSALSERGAALMEVARLLGAGSWRRIREVALPLARPALAAGVALALMETLADYGVGSYFGLQTFTTGIYKAWLSMGNREAASQLASMLLGVVALLLWLEQQAQKRLRFATVRSRGAEAKALTLRGWVAVAAFMGCALPVLLGFALPVMVLLRSLWEQSRTDGVGLPWERFAGWAGTSFALAAVASGLACLVAFGLAFAVRTSAWAAGQGAGVRRRVLAVVVRGVGLGYAVPGAVVAIGILMPVAWLQAQGSTGGIAPWVTGTVLGVMYAYLMRFCAVSLQSVEAGYARISPSLDETARMLGTSRWRLWISVHLPLLRRAGFSALLLVFVDVMKELPATLVLRPFNSDTLAVVAYQLARDERLAEAALPSLAIVLVGLLPVIALSRSLRSSE